MEKLDPTEGLTAVKNDVGWGFIDNDGKVVIPCQFNAVRSFTDGKAVVKAGGDDDDDDDDWRKTFLYIDAK